MTFWGDGVPPLDVRFPQVPLVLKKRDRFLVDAKSLDRVIRSADVRRLEELDWNAKLAGDLDALGVLTGAHLRAQRQVNAGIGRERLILQLALARGSRTDVRKFDDLRHWCDAVRDGLVLAKIESLEFGFRDSKSLEKSFVAAGKRLDALESRLQRKLAVFGDWAAVIRDISFVGDIFVCDAICKAMFAEGDGGWAHAVYAAHLRHLHKKPLEAIAVSGGILKVAPNRGALTNLAASYVDVEQFANAREVALVAIAFHPSIYVFRTGARAFKYSGDFALQAICLDVWRHFDRNAFPPVFRALDRYHSHRAVELLSIAGRRDLVEVALRGLWIPDLWAKQDREHADSIGMS